MSRDVGFSYLDGLNDVQRQAVTEINGPVMVIAGPGSGKTRVLTFRIAHMLRMGVHPGQILALTFTNKAAREMKDRIERVAGNDANKVWAGTFHSLFARILRREASKIGYPNDFTIYDTDDTKGLITEIIKGLNLDTKVYNPGAVRSRISSAKSNLITPKAYALNEDLMALDRMNRRPHIHTIYEKYVARCTRAGAMDFDDLLLQMYRLLYQNPEGVRERYQRQFQFLMVDEFQDTNYLQYEILKLLVVYPQSNSNICIVGDDAQSIYSFRGATIENILQFESDFPAVKTFKLEQNYRSTEFIVGAANEVINYNQKQIPKKIWTDRPEGKKIKLIKALTDTEEGKRVSDSIIEQKNRYNLKNSDFAILYRTNGQSRVFEESLRRYNILYRVFGGLSFYQRKEVKDLLGYLRLTANDKDDEALKRVVNYPRRGIGNKTMEQLAEVADAHDMSMWEVLNTTEISSRSNKSLLEFVELIKDFKVKAAQSNAYETANYIARQSGLLELLRADTSLEGKGRLENLDSLMDGIKEFVEDDELDAGEDFVTDKSLSAFLQNITLMTDQDNTEGDQTDYVSLMSVHAAKGLEFKSVFVVGCEENLFPSYMSISDPNGIEEERRLFYVAITRAEEHLTLSLANSRYQYGDMRFNDPSRFLEEIGDQHLDPLYAMQKGGGQRHDDSFGFPEPKLLGNFKPKSLSQSVTKFDLSNFKADPFDQIKEGHRVLHQKFGPGKVTAIDNRDVATIVFEEISNNEEKRIMLKYAKLQILED